MKLVIFDLDETLLKKSGKGANVFHDRLSFAVNKVFGVNTNIGMVVSFGKTDSSIMLELAQMAGINKTTAKKQIEKLRRAAIEYCRKHVKEYTCAVIKGVKPLLRKLKKEGYVLCLATGNLEPVARLKLEKVGLDRFFDFELSGFGVSLKRADLINTAINHVKRKYGRIYRKNVFYIGDSPLDIKGSKEANVNMIAIATGNYSLKALKKEEPDYVLMDLSDTGKVLRILNQSDI